MALFSKGLMLTQNKEPALSKKLVQFTNSRHLQFNSEIEDIKDVDNLSSKDIINIAKQAEIVDERDGRLLVSKLRRAENKATIIYVDAIDDEPYVSSKINPMLQLSDEVIFGIKLCAKVVGNENIVIKTYKHIGNIDTSMPTKLGEYPVERLSGGYPALPSFSQVKDKGKSERLIVGIGPLIHLTRAVLYRTIQSTTFITVAGNSIASPMNLEVSLGMNFTEILQRCGLINEPTKVVSGGSMTGVSVIDTDNTIITPTTRAILAFHSKNYERAYSCIGCGRCEKVCPAGLNPMYIYDIMKQKICSQLKPFDPEYCIDCGSCSYVCPSRLDVSGTVKKAKDLLKKEEENSNINVNQEVDDEVKTV